MLWKKSMNQRASSDSGGITASFVLRSTNIVG